MRLLPALVVVAAALPGAGCSVILDSGDADSDSEPTPEADAGKPLAGGDGGSRPDASPPLPPVSDGSGYSLNIEIVEEDPVLGQRVDVTNVTEDVLTPCYGSCELPVTDADLVRLEASPTPGFVRYEPDLSSSCGYLDIDNNELAFYVSGDCTITAYFGLAPAVR